MAVGLVVAAARADGPVEVVVARGTVVVGRVAVDETDAFRTAGVVVVEAGLEAEETVEARAAPVDGVGRVVIVLAGPDENSVGGLGQSDVHERAMRGCEGRWVRPRR